MELKSPDFLYPLGPAKRAWMSLLQKWDPMLHHTASHPSPKEGEQARNSGWWLICLAVQQALVTGHLRVVKPCSLQQRRKARAASEAEKATEDLGGEGIKRILGARMCLTWIFHIKASGIVFDRVLQAEVSPPHMLKFWLPGPPQNVTVFGDRIFKEVIMIKWGH